MRDIIGLLSPEHIKDLELSGLSDETILKAGIRSVPPSEIRKKLGFDIADLVSCYEIPYPHNFSRFKCFYENGGQGKPKYLQKKGSGNHLYIPNILDPKILKDPSVPLYLTEGEKKALKATQEGIPCISIAGLWNWSNGSGELIPDFDQIEFKNRQVFIVPDNDWLRPNKHGYKKNLEEAVRKFALKLIERGAEPYIIDLPHSEEKIGLDDYLCKNTFEDFLKLPIKQITLNVEKYKKALEILRSDNPLGEIVKELSKSYIMREKELKLVYLATLLSKLGENFLFIVTGESASGKSSLVSTVLKSVPDAYRLTLYSASSKALLYRKKDLKNTVLWIQEFSGATEIIELLKALTTEKIARHDTVNDSKQGKIYQSFEIKAEGFICFITTTKEVFDEQFSNRAFVLNIYATPEILEAITSFQAEKAKGNVHESTDFEVLREIFGLISSQEVLIPYADEIQKRLKKVSARVTRDFPKILSLIKAHSLLNQFNRRKINDKIVATTEDYQAVYEIADLVVESVSALKQHHSEFLKACSEWITRSELSKLLGKTQKTVSNYIKELKEYLEIEGKGSEQKVKAVYIPEDKINLPTPDDIIYKSSFPNFQNSRSPEKSLTYIGNCQISENFLSSDFDVNGAENGKNGNDGKNANFPSNSLKNKGKIQIGKLETEIYTLEDFDESKLEVLDW